MSVYYDQEILNGLTEIAVSGCPGTMVITGDKSQAVFTGGSTDEVFMAASEYVNGRVFVATHDCYFGWIDKTSNDCQKALMNNIKKWVTKRQNIDDLKIIDMASASEKTNFKDFTLVKWRANKEINDVIQKSLLDYISSGGGLICVATPWGFLQTNPTKTFEDMSMFRFLKNNLGIVFTDCYLGPPERIPVSENKARFGNFNKALAEVTNNINDIDKYFNTIQRGIPILREQCVMDGESLRKVAKSLQKQCEEKKLNVFGRKTMAIKDLKEKEVTCLLCNCLIGIKGEKAPNIEEFPGDFSTLPNLLIDITVNLEAQFEERLSTGFYAPAGVPIIVKVVSGEYKGWKLRIGAHTDNLSDNAQFSRWPIVSTEYNLSQEIQISSPFGGLVYFDCPRKGKITVKLFNVVEAPYYDVLKPETVQKWESSRNTAPGLWAEVAGKYVIFTCPSDCVRNLKDPKELLDFWDQVIIQHHKCRGTDAINYRRERIVSDKQTSAGYMHSGYPIVTHLDVCYESCKECIFNLEKLKANGNWGLFHEIGHNMQRDEWTFEGCGEVTVNLFSMHAMEFVVGKTLLQIPWVQGRNDAFKKYFSKQPTYDDWQANCEMALMMFAVLIKYFGWDKMRKFLSDYEEDMKAKRNLPQSDQEKIDQWILRYSKLVNVNVSPLFQMWGLPVSTTVQSQLQTMAPWFPINEKNPEIFYKPLN